MATSYIGARRMRGEARFDGPYRYWLLREWDTELPMAAWCGLNPSTAGATRNDQTIRRVVDFSDRAGYGRLIMLNLFALISTNPAALVRHADPIGPDNDQFLWKLTEGIDVVACWGGSVPTYWQARAHAIAYSLRRDRICYTLGLTRTGQPLHPSRLASTTPLARWLPSKANR
jgi:hypothetical protein